MIVVAKLTANVLLNDPETGEPVALEAGSELPGWAVELVGDHVLDKGDEKPARRTAGK